MTFTRLVLLTLSMFAAAAQAAPLPGNDLERQCWQKHTRERTRIDLKNLTAVYFSNLATGYGDAALTQSRATLASFLLFRDAPARCAQPDVGNA